MTRTPTNCPHCSYNGGLDGLGRFKRKSNIAHVDGGTITYIQTWERFHCPECDEIFALLSDETEVDE